MTDTKKFYNVKQLSEILGVNQMFIVKHIKEIPHYKLGYKTIRFDLDEVTKWMESQTKKNDKVEIVDKMK